MIFFTYFYNTNTMIVIQIELKHDDGEIITEYILMDNYCHNCFMYETTPIYCGNLTYKYKDVVKRKWDIISEVRMFIKLNIFKNADDSHLSNLFSKLQEREKKKFIDNKQLILMPPPLTRVNYYGPDVNSLWEDRKNMNKFADRAKMLFDYFFDINIYSDVIIHAQDKYFYEISNARWLHHQKQDNVSFKDFIEFYS